VVILPVTDWSYSSHVVNLTIFRQSLTDMKV